MGEQGGSVDFERLDVCGYAGTVLERLPRLIDHYIQSLIVDEIMSGLQITRNAAADATPML